MQRSVVLNDFESVQTDSIEALNHEHFQVLLFCGANQTKVPIEIASTLQKLTRRIHARARNELPVQLRLHYGNVPSDFST